jgi:hypothetical protein
MLLGEVSSGSRCVSIQETAQAKRTEDRVVEEEEKVGLE